MAVLRRMLCQELPASFSVRVPSLLSSSPRVLFIPPSQCWPGSLQSSASTGLLQKPGAGGGATDASSIPITRLMIFGFLPSRQAAPQSHGDLAEVGAREPVAAVHRRLLLCE